MNDSELTEAVQQWLSSQRTPTGQEAAHDLARTLHTVTEMQRVFQLLHGFLARHPDRLPQLQGVLAQLVAQRHAMIARVGERLLDWHLEGGTIELRAASAPPTVIAPSSNSDTPSTPPLGVHGPWSDALQLVADGAKLASEPPPNTTQPPPALLDALLNWGSNARSRSSVPTRLSDRPLVDDRQRRILAHLVGVLGPPRDLFGTEVVAAELDALEASTTPELMGQWAHLSKPLQRAWLAVMVARTRAIKELPALPTSTRERIKSIILNYPAFAKGQQPGYVNGLQVAHQPDHGSWAADAQAHWATVVDWMGEVNDSPEPPFAISPLPTVVSISSSRPAAFDDEFGYPLPGHQHR